MSGCGCGQGGGHGSDCGCRRASASGLVRDGAFTRPSFFDGQLLCADDLQALAAYTRGKDRLHNRYLVGAGAVCGLEVGCSRAEEGSVVVRAGYALDCCGNDIVVPCDQTVDINQLVAELPHDAGCADPCPPPVPKNDDQKNDDQKNDDQKDKEERAGESETVAKPPPRCYQLVVEYAETPGDLVAPYSTGEEGASVCEPTRFHEGYRFALRCGPDEREPTGLLAALAHCAKIRDRLDKLEEAAKETRELASAAQGPLPGAPAETELAEARERLRAAAELPQAVRLAALAVRLAAAGQAEQARQALDDIRERLEDVRESARDAAGRDPLAPARAGALAAQVASLAGRLERPEPTRLDRLLAEGIVGGQQVSEGLRSLVLEARDWALCWLERRPGSRCRTLERTLTALVVPDEDRPEELRRAAQVVIDALKQILLDCVCAAVNPPCAPCEDTAVVLAEVAVERCKVVEICNQVRRYAVTGTALRYWLPFDWAEQWLAEFCCGEADLDKVLGWLREPKRFLGGYLGREERRPVAEPEPPAAPAEPLTQNQQRLLTMLNSQVQGMQAKLRRLERQAAERQPDG
jgi:hypothetical protein